MKAVLYTDGGARGNPGPAAIAFVLRIRGKETVIHSEYVGETTNNQAEYRALLAGLQRAREKTVDEVECFLDSELVVRQLEGEYRVKEKNLRPLVESVKTLAREFAHVVYKHIPREKNKEADRLVNETLDARDLREQ